MKFVMLFVMSLVVMLPTSTPVVSTSIASTPAVEPSLAAIMERFSREPNCSSNLMQVRFTLISQTPPTNKLQGTNFHYIVSAFAVDGCLKRREMPGQGFPVGVKPVTTYYEFSDSGSLSFTDSDFSGNATRFELTLGQPAGFLGRQRADLGTLVIIYPDRRQNFTLPDSLTITEVDGGRSHYVYGEIGRGSAVISLRISGVHIDG